LGKQLPLKHKKTLLRSFEYLVSFSINFLLISRQDFFKQPQSPLVVGFFLEAIKCKKSRFFFFF